MVLSAARQQEVGPLKIGQREIGQHEVGQLEFRHQRQMVRHAPPNAAARYQQARRQHATRENLIQLRQRQTRGESRLHRSVEPEQADDAYRSFKAGHIIADDAPVIRWERTVPTDRYD